MKEMTGYKCEICGNIFTEEEYGDKTAARLICQRCEESHGEEEFHKLIYYKGNPYPSFVDVTFKDGASVRYSRDF